MASILKFIADHHMRTVCAGEIALEQGGASTHLLVLVKGEVEVLRDEVHVAKVSVPGAMFGEMSVLLNCPYTATVRATRDSVFAMIEEPRQFLASASEISLFVAEQLAQRLDSLNRYLIDVKSQYEGHDHLGMVDNVLETLMNRPPRRVVRPAEPAGP